MVPEASVLVAEPREAGALIVFTDGHPLNNDLQPVGQCFLAHPLGWRIVVQLLQLDLGVLSPQICPNRINVLIQPGVADFQFFQPEVLFQLPLKSGSLLGPVLRQDAHHVTNLAGGADHSFQAGL